METEIYAVTENRVMEGVLFLRTNPSRINECVQDSDIDQQYGALWRFVDF